MTTILVINAISSLLAAAGLGGFVAREKRRRAAVRPLYVATGTTRPRRTDG